VCPHRLAPLSEGRIDREKGSAGVVQCSYHGWEFDSDGKCVCIPQVTTDVQDKVIVNKRAQVASYPTCVNRNVLWCWPWKDDPLTVVADESAHPEGIMKGLGEEFSTYTRDLPYGWDSLVENLIDPAHIAFAHHGLQGKRTDAIPINMTMNGNVKERGFGFDWSDRTMGMIRHGSAEFRGPYMVTYDGTFEVSNKPFQLSVLCIPTKPGWSRAIIMQRKQRAVKTLVQKIFKAIPLFLIHQLSNKFLDSDLAFLHYQERNTERGHKYFVPAPADLCVTAFRQWIPKYTNYLETNSPLPPEMPKSQLFDRYAQHTAHCKQCQAAMKGMVKWRRRCYALLAVSVLGIQKFWAARISTLMCLAALRIMQKLDRSMRVGGFNHYENH